MALRTRTETSLVPQATPFLFLLQASSMLNLIATTPLSDVAPLRFDGWLRLGRGLILARVNDDPITHLLRHAEQLDTYWSQLTFASTFIFLFIALVAVGARLYYRHLKGINMG
ncbi:hypothetical protein K469DRAFT_294319 [Zopfia rhizophila CBS 207.26]|uniref:Uncharacterized protein n=1 Tax=Zopfia rhizophila CBS 207.26 TaxID=1314779 RepID=A0A6A6DPG2_9PEZI|nr:hypothetical protein K469DRAFT_294319 [Zopfia rhizophila CBS 207.26]